MKSRSILLVGAPGAGKGTQGRAIGTMPGFFHFACGDVFRTLDKSSELGKIFVEYSSRGELVPDDITVKLWLDRLQQLRDASEWVPDRDILLLDGIPRNIAQAKLMEAHTDVLRIVELVCNDRDVLIERIRGRALKSNRLDDADEDVIRHRLDVFEEDTRVLIEHYPSTLLRRVNAEQPALHVLADVIEAIRDLA